MDFSKNDSDSLAKQMSEIRVRKNTGELVPFDETKLKEALNRSGATEQDVLRVSKEVEAALYDGITTKTIYQIAYSKLRKLSHRSAGRYRLKKALFQLGPSGFPFEHFVARLFELQGFTVETGKIVQGKCVQHEVDMIARKQSEIVMAECKFHQTEGAKSDVKTSLYVRSRFTDILDKLQEEETGSFHFRPMLITNTRFTLDAERYGKCSGLKMLSWDFPRGNSLKDWIDRSGFHPITVLKSLTKKEKKILMDKGIVLCREILNDPDQLMELNLSQRKKSNIVKEAKSLI